MKQKILDCTLRDGGYVNDWRFGNETIKSIVSMLTNANVDIIECGFLEDKPCDATVSLFNTVAEIRQILPENRKKSEYVAMAVYGNYSLEHLEECDGSSITGIRITFHDYEIDEALRYCAHIKEKGYKTFFQPVGMSVYTDKQLIDLIEQVNKLEPYAFYIVDTLGLMNQKDIERLSYLLDNNLIPSIAMGFHSHNNLQLSFSDAQKFLSMNTGRTKIVDASIYGMGRGAGNLSTELIAHYINETGESAYDVDILLKIYDQHIRKIREHFEWGYSVVYYLAAIHKCHPNYAKFLLDLGTLPINDIGNILMSIEFRHKHLYDKDYIVSHYSEYQNHQIDDSAAYAELKPLVEGRPVLIIAPGKSISEYTEEIRHYIDIEKPYIFSVNHKSEIIVPSSIFCPNLKRYEEMVRYNQNTSPAKIIITSNIKTPGQADFRFNYSDLRSTNGKFIDNATIMLLKLLTAMKPRSVALAGMDGFSITSDNYYNNDFQNIQDKQAMYELNKTVSSAISYYAENMNIIFLTPSIYVKGEFET